MTSNKSDQKAIIKPVILPKGWVTSWDHKAGKVTITSPSGATATFKIIETKQEGGEK